MATPKKSTFVAAAPKPEQGVEATPIFESASFEHDASVDLAPHLEEPPSIVEPTPVAPPLDVEAAVGTPFKDVAKLIEGPLASVAEAQGKVRSLVETGITETHSKYSQIKSAADEAAHAIETSYATVKNGAVQFNVRALETLSETANANFAFFKSVFGVKSPSDYVALQSEFARKQIEIITAHTKALSELAQKLAVETVEPIKAQVAKTFNLH